MKFHWLFLLFLASPVVGQSGFTAGGQLAAVMSIGTHHTNIGLRINAYAAVENAQLNIGTTFRYHAINLGGRNHFTEWRHHAGLVAMFGKPDVPVNFQFDGVYHQSRHPWSFGYMYMIWRDPVGSSQRAGAFNLGLSHFDVYFENDILAFQGRDRFRTGFVSVSYRNADYRISAGSEMWTGETRGSIWDKTPGKKMPGGYRKLADLPFGRTSHGIAFVGFQQLIQGSSYYDLRLGVDDENVRHILQNRLSHDLILFPQKVKRHTPHYPRLDADGYPAFDKPVRPTRMYFQTGLNNLNAY